MHEVGRKALNRTAMLVHVTVESTWGARKQHVGMGREGANAYGVDADMARAVRKLMPPTPKGQKPTPDSYDALQRDIRELATYNESLTLPWDRGQRVLLASRYWEWQAGVNARVAAVEQTKARFATAFDRHVAEAQSKLGVTFNARDYPSDISSRFVPRVTVDRFPDAEDFRIDGLSGAIEEDLRASIQARADEVHAIAQREVGERVSKVAKHLAERLALYSVGPNGKVSRPFRDSLLENVSDLVEILPALNVAEDPEITATIFKLRALVDGTDLETLRASEVERAAVAKQAEEILAHVGGFLA